MTLSRYDVFISHAFEDKSQVADPINAALRKAGYEVWYSGTNIKVGEELSEAIIGEAIPRSDYGIVIISPDFMRSEWTFRELKEFRKKKKDKLRPVFHNITASQVAEKYPFLVEHFATNTNKGIDAVVYDLIRAMPKKSPFPWLLMILVMITVILGSATWLFSEDNKEEEETRKREFSVSIDRRVEHFQRELVSDHLEEMKLEHGKEITPEELTNLYTKRTALKGPVKNEYHFSNGYDHVSGRKNLDKMGFPVYSFAPPDAFKFREYQSYLLKNEQPEADPKAYVLCYVFFNLAKVIPSISDVEDLNDSTALITVEFKEPLRYVKANLSCIQNTGYRKTAKLIYKGFKFRERYHFQKQNNHWNLVSVE